MNELIVIVAKGCPACELLKQNANSLNVKFMDVVDSVEAKQIAEELGITHVPSVVARDKETGKICLLDDELKAVKCGKDVEPK